MTEKDKPIRILIADDHQLVRQGLMALLSVKPGIEVIGQAADGVEAVELARSLEPDIVLLDLLMPNKDGIEATREIKAEDPDARILIITSFSEDENVYQAIKAGALGYLLKDSSPQELMQAIHDVCEGRLSLHPNIPKDVPTRRSLKSYLSVNARWGHTSAVSSVNCILPIELKQRYMR